MSRQLGSRYVLDDVIGRGASGQVWRGHDADGAMYAFKVLRDSISDDAGSVARFVQERTILLSLDHPNLVRVHDMVVEGETLALVMELVTGGDLRSYLAARGTLSPEEACSLTVAIAEGLAAMHAAGIIHRDIKPENILIDTTSGTPVPKISDFSIARIVSTAKQSTMMAGTPSYVAPELFDDSPPTEASDIYSLGIVFYELLAGVPPFRTESLLSMMKMHATEPPPRPPGVPDPLWVVLERFLAKNPANRVPNAAAAARLIRIAGLPQSPDRTLPPVERTLPRASPVTAVGVPPAAEQTYVRPASASASASAAVPAPALPSDAPRAAAGKPVLIAALALAALVAAMVPVAVWLAVRSDDVRHVQASAAAEPGARCRIAFARDHQIYVMGVDGSNQTMLDVGKSDEDDPAWSPDDKRIAFVVTYGSADGAQGDIWIMNADGTEPRAVTAGDGDDRNPEWSPDGRQIAFTRWFETDGEDDADVFVASVDGSSARPLAAGADKDGRPTWSPDGTRIAFVRWARHPDGGDDGDIVVADADGSAIVPVTTGETNDNYPAWSPDGSRIAFERQSSRANESKSDIWVTEVDGSGQLALTHADSFDRYPAWSPDGGRVAFTRISGVGDSAEGDIYVAEVEGGQPLALTNTDQSDAFAAWSPGCGG